MSKLKEGDLVYLTDPLRPDWIIGEIVNVRGFIIIVRRLNSGHGFGKWVAAGFSRQDVFRIKNLSPLQRAILVEDYE